MSDDEIQQAVVGMLTAGIEAGDRFADGLADPGQLDPGVLDALNRPLWVSASISARLPPGPLAVADVQKLVDEVAHAAGEATAAHYQRLLGCMVAVFHELATEAAAAGVDVGGLLHRRGVEAAL
jgi:hypothetical protein